MTSRSFFRARTPAIVVACMLLAGFARADIVKCVDVAGGVTYTNVSCLNGSSPAPASANSANSVSPAGVLAADGVILKKNAIDRIGGPDVATLKAAKSSMQLMDRATLSSRQQKLARLN
jgi:hypothetical protein